MKEGIKMDAFRRAVNALRLIQGRWQGIRQSVIVHRAEAQDVSANLNTVLDVLEDAIATAEAMRNANVGEVATLMDWGGRLDAYAAKIEADDPATADIIRALAGEVGKMADARRSRL
jgi:hypothetical protein